MDFYSPPRRFNWAHRIHVMKRIVRHTPQYMSASIVTSILAWSVFFLARSWIKMMPRKFRRTICLLSLYYSGLLAIKFINKRWKKYRKYQNPKPYYDIWETQLNNTPHQYNQYYTYAWTHWHEMEERILFFLATRGIFIGA